MAAAKWLVRRTRSCIRHVVSHCRGVGTSSSGGKGNEILRHIAEHGSQPFSKVTLKELVSLKDWDHEHRLQHLEKALHVGISKIVLLLQDLPLGFSAIGQIRGVVQDYVTDLWELQECRYTDSEKFHACIYNIFKRHRGIIVKISRGLQEFEKEISSGFEPFADLEYTTCADVSETVHAMRRIELALDEFFTIRTTLRLLIAHCIQLNPSDRGNQNIRAMHELLVRIPDNSRLEFSSRSYVGAVCLNTSPPQILIEAYRHAARMCREEFDRTAPLLVNDMLEEDYLREQDACGDGACWPEMASFPYVDIHLYFVFFEVLKNALLTSVLKAGPNQELPPIEASLIADRRSFDSASWSEPEEHIEGLSFSSENMRTVKIADAGEGMKREQVRKVWSYFFSTVRRDNACLPPPPRVSGIPHGHSESEVTLRGLGKPMPMVGRGLGLPVSRVLVRYFGGEIDLHSLHRKGTDVYIYL